MKKILFISIMMITSFTFYVSAQTKTYVPDDNFENYLETHNQFGMTVPVGDPDSMGDGIIQNDSVTTSRINSVTYLNLMLLYPNTISSLIGIEDFTALTDLYCSDNNLSSLDISSNVSLENLDCRANQLSSLDVSSNVLLEKLDCSMNQLSSLDVSSNINLQELRCGANMNLSTIDLTNNTNLIKFDGSSNSFSSIDVSQNILLEELSIDSNQLSSIDVSQNPNLYDLNIGFNNISSIDLTHNPLLGYFLCYDNQIVDLDFSNNPNLFYLYCAGNPIDSLDLSNNHMLNLLSCFDTPISYLDMRNGNNTNVCNSCFRLDNSPNLYCISVDDSAWSTENWTHIDSHTSFSNDCNTSSETSLPYNENTIKIYPNPTNDIIHIDIGRNYQKMTDYTLKIVNILGQTVYEKLINSELMTVNVNRLGITGFYFVNIIDNNGQAIEIKRIILE